MEASEARTVAGQPSKAWVVGAYDMVVIFDAPNDEAFAKLAISIAKGGHIRSTTLKAFDETQYRKIIESVG